MCLLQLDPSCDHHLANSGIIQVICMMLTRSRELDGLCPLTLVDSMNMSQDALGVPHHKCKCFATTPHFIKVGNRWCKFNSALAKKNTTCVFSDMLNELLWCPSPNPLIFSPKEDSAFEGVFFNDRYDDLPPVCGILWFWLLLRLICHCNRLDLHATFVGFLRFDPRGGSWNFPLEIHAARDQKF